MRRRPAHRPRGRNLAGAGYWSPHRGFTGRTLGIEEGWLQLLARINPLTYQVDALRALMIAGGSSSFGLVVDFLVLLGVFVVLVDVAAEMYPRMVT